MNQGRLNYVIVGSFVIVMLVALVVVLAMLTGRTGSTEAYYTHYEEVSGVKYGTPVLFAGYPVGQVEDVEPEYEGGNLRFRVTLGVTEGWPIPADSIAEVKASGLLGVITIDIREGHSEATLEPGDTLDGRPAPNLFASVASIAGVAGELAERDLRPLLGNLNTLIVSLNRITDDNAPVILGDLQAVSGRINDASETVIDDLTAVSGSLRANMNRLSSLLSDQNLQHVNQVLAGVDSAAANFSDLSSDLRGTGAELNRLLSNLNAVVADNKLDVDRTVMDLRFSMHAIAERIESVAANLEGTSRNMYEFTRQIRQNPASILGSARIPDTDR
ncbi:MAG: hypothetical protein CMM50_02325 [Rhodospirillaceae bacterium]|nr:hypothetical protein [Rhodospirillaceae bacterium]|tara:strand:- start:578 stop:1570 length:993 start_codon:yes stop_codon:yes gene_type:complete